MPETEDATWQTLAPLLDDAMASLKEKDRNAILLCFFQGKTNFKEMGRALGTSEDSARMRVGRAVEKLRSYFVKRKIAVPSVLLTTVLAAETVSAVPPGLALTITATAAGKGAAAGASTLSIIDATLRMMAWLKLKSAALLSASALLVVFVSYFAVKVVQTGREPAGGPETIVQAADLGDGTELILEKVTFGTNHIFSINPAVQKQTDHETFVFWFSQREKQSGLYRSPKFAGVQVLDEHGCALDLFDLGYAAGFGPKKIRDIPIRAFPRRQEEFVIQVYDLLGASKAPLARFTTGNPKPILNPLELKPQSPAQISVARDLTAEFAGFQIARNQLAPHSYTPEFRFFERGVRSREWFADQLCFSDATGNRLTQFRVNGYEGLCLYEPAWKIEAMVFRDPAAEFPATLKWQPEALPAPEDGHFKFQVLPTYSEGVICG